MHDKDKSQAAGVLKRFLQEESVALAKLDYTVSEHEVEKTAKKLEKSGKQTNEALHLKHAGNLTNLSIAMKRLGGLDLIACERAKQAIDIYRSLVRPNKPVEFDQGYASCLNTYAIRLKDSGQTHAALTTAKQALDIRERLATKKPHLFEPDYAISLSNYASHLKDSGLTYKALTTAKQALDIIERLVKKNPDKFEPNYATSLDNYANRLSDSGQTDALTTAKKALDIRKRLVVKNPDRFEPDYTISLNNYANRLSDSGQTDNALTTIKQALDITKRLAAKNPNRYEAHWFICNCNMLFLAWLADPTVVHSAPPNLPSQISVHKTSELAFHLAFVQGCLAIDHEQQGAAFASAFQVWQTHSIAQKNNGRSFFLCICAWLHQYRPDVLLDDAFAADWQAFKQQRGGNLPRWMETVTERWRLVWPD